MGDIAGPRTARAVVRLRGAGELPRLPTDRRRGSEPYDGRRGRTGDTAGWAGLASALPCAPPGAESMLTSMSSSERRRWRRADDGRTGDTVGCPGAWPASASLAEASRPSDSRAWAKFEPPERAVRSGEDAAEDDDEL